MIQIGQLFRPFASPSPSRRGPVAISRRLGPSAPPWDPEANPPADTLNLDSSLFAFAYTPSGTVPDGAYGDTLELDASLVDFSYTI
jgi:hypothetical protein